MTRDYVNALFDQGTEATKERGKHACTLVSHLSHDIQPIGGVSPTPLSSASLVRATTARAITHVTAKPAQSFRNMTAPVTTWEGAKVPNKNKQDARSRQVPLFSLFSFVLLFVLFLLFCERLRGGFELPHHRRCFTAAHGRSRALWGCSGRS